MCTTKETVSALAQRPTARTCPATPAPTRLSAWDHPQHQPLCHHDEMLTITKPTQVHTHRNAQCAQDRQVQTSLCSACSSPRKFEGIANQLQARQHRKRRNKCHRLHAASTLLTGGPVDWPAPTSQIHRYSMRSRNRYAHKAGIERVPCLSQHRGSNVQVDGAACGAAQTQDAWYCRQLLAKQHHGCCLSRDREQGLVHVDEEAQLQQHLTYSTSPHATSLLPGR